jgi:3-hydroxyisobutyrate dehydrogenase-like beta-hydroxyacid dehydrogenase
MDDAGRATAFQERARDIGVEVLSTNAEAVAGAELVICAVVASQTVVAAEATGPHMKAGQYYLDINSTSPMEKRQAAGLVEAAGGAYVESAVMDLVPPHGLAVPMLLAGEKAAELSPLLNGLGMNTQAVGTEIGQSSAIKMIRSVFLKGFTSILLESLTAAHRVGVADRVLESLAVTFPGIDWPQTADYYLARLCRHAGRQASEMKSVAATLEDLGVAPLTAKASGERLAWFAGLELLEHFAPDDPPADFRKVLDAALEAEKE